MVPIDKNLIDRSLLNKNEKQWINDYHQNVFNKLRSFMNNIEFKDFKKPAQLFKISFHSFSFNILTFNPLA